MTVWLQCARLIVPLAALFALSQPLRVNGGAPPKEWKGGNDNASNGNNYDNNGSGNSPPGQQDRVKHSTGQMVIDTALTFGSLEFTGGSILGLGTAALTLADATSLWTGGDFTAAATLNMPGLTIGTGSTKKLNNGAKLNLLGTTTWSGDDITTGNGASLNNETGGTFNVTGNGKIAHDSSLGGTRATFKNDGTFTKSSSGTTEIESTFQNNGSVNVQAGVLKLKGGGSGAANVNLTAGTTLQIADLDYAFTGGNITGNGTIDITGATTTFNSVQGGNAHVKVSGGTAKFNSSLTTNGTLTLEIGALDVDGAATTTAGGLTWTGGNITTNAGSNTATTVAITGNSTIGGGTNKKLGNNATLALGGNTTWDGSQIDLGNSAKIANQAGVTFTVSGGGTIAHADAGDRPTFSNAGSFTKADGNTDTVVSVKFDNTGNVNANAGRLQLSGGGSSTGNVTILDNANIVVASNDYTFNSGALNGAGTGAIQVQGVTATFGNTSGNATIDLGWGTVKFDGAHNGSGKLSLGGGNVQGTGSASLGPLDWTGGNITGANISVTSANISGNGTKKVADGGQLNLSGNTSWSPTWGGGANDITTGGANSKIRNTGNLTTDSDSAIGHDGGEGRATFRNEGTFTKVNTTSYGTTQIDAKFENTVGARVQIDGGSLKLTGGGFSSGNVAVAGGANIIIQGTDFAFSGGALDGGGIIDLTGNTTTLSDTTGSASLRVNGGNLSFNGTHTGSGTVYLQSGKVAGNSTASVGTLDWTGGDIGNVTLTTTAGLIGGKNAKKVSDGAQLNLGGVTSWISENISTTGSATKLKNTGTFSIVQDGGKIANEAGGNRATFENMGTVHKSNTSAGGTTEIEARFDNTSTGAVQIDGGVLKLSGGGASNGAFSIASGGFVEVNSNDYAFSTGNLSGSGSIEIRGANAIFGSTTGSAAIHVDGGNARFDGAHVGTGAFRLLNGTVSTGTGTAEFGSIDWTGGNLNGKVKSSGNMTISGVSSKTIGAQGELTLSGALDSISGGDVTNQGKITKNGAGLTEIHSKFDSTGTLAVDAGTLTLIGGGKASNAVTVGNSTKIQVGTLDYTFEDATITGAGSGEVELLGATTKFKNTSSSAKVSLNGGNLDFDTSVSTFGSLSLTSGNVTSTGTGSADVTSLEWTGGLLNGKVKNTGNASISGAGAKTIGSLGELTLSGTSSIAGGDVTNQGKLIKSGAGATEITAKFDSTGTLTANTGSLKLSGGGKSSNTVSVGNGAKLQVSGSDYTFENVTLTGTGSGEIELLGATTKFKSANSSAKVAVNGGNIDFDSTLSTLGTLSVASGNLTSTGLGSADVNALEWTGGTLNGKVKSTGSASISGVSAKSIGSQGELTLSGTSSITGGNVTNQGKLTKNAAGLTEFQTKFDSSGTIAADAGTLKLSGGGKTSNSVTIGNGAKLQIATTDYLLENATVTGTGSGEIELLSATTKFKDSVVNAKVSVNGGNIDFDTSVTDLGTLALASGNVTSSGTGSANVTALEWTAGNLNGKVKSNGSATLSGSNTKTIGALGELTLGGSTNSISGGDVVNQGKFIKGGSGSTDVLSKLESSGTISADAGVLKLTGGGKASNSVAIGHGAKIQISASDYFFENATLTGDGELEIGAKVQFKNSGGQGKVRVSGGTVEFDTSVYTGDSLIFGSGNLNSTNGGSAEVNSLTWTGGVLNGKLKSNGSKLGGGEKQLSNGAELLLNGTTNWDGSTLKVGSSSKITNGAVFVADADGTLTNLGGGIFVNNGTFSKSGGAGGTTKIETRFENNGSLQINTGKVHLTGGGKNASGASILVASAALLEIDGDLELTANSVLDGQGQGKLLSGKLTAHGTVGLKNFSFDGANATLAGSNTFNGTVDWNAGHWNSDVAGVSTIIASSGILNLRHSSNSEFDGRSILNHGIVNWHAGNLRGGNGNGFTNQNLFNDLASGNKSISSQGGAFTFTNNGTYMKSANGTTTMSADFINNGTIHIAAGQLVFSSTFSNNGSVKVTNGASAQFSAPLNFGVNAPLQGTGTIQAPSVTAAGIVAPGVSPGTLTVTGNLTLLSTSSLLIEIGGTSQGINYDFLSVGGIGTVGGNLEVSFLNGFQSTVSSTDQFTVFTAAGSLLGSFDNVPNGLRVPVYGFGSFQVNYGVTSMFSASSVVLSHFSTVIPEPSTYAMIGLGAVFVLFTLRRRK